MALGNVLKGFGSRLMALGSIQSEVMKIVNRNAPSDCGWSGI